MSKTENIDKEEKTYLQQLGVFLPCHRWGLLHVGPPLWSTMGSPVVVQ
jgi:hypothetical protein